MGDCEECIRLERALAARDAAIARVLNLIGDIGPEARRILVNALSGDALPPVDEPDLAPVNTGKQRGVSASLGVMDEAQEAPAFCRLPPQGWYCTRLDGHDGMCAAFGAMVPIARDHPDEPRTAPLGSGRTAH